MLKRIRKMHSSCHFAAKGIEKSQTYCRMVRDVPRYSQAHQKISCSLVKICCTKGRRQMVFEASHEGQLTSKLAPNSTRLDKNIRQSPVVIRRCHAASLQSAGGCREDTIEAQRLLSVDISSEPELSGSTSKSAQEQTARNKLSADHAQLPMASV